MRHRYLLMLLCFCIALTASGQQVADMNWETALKHIRKAPWKKERLTKGLVWQYYHFADLYGARQHVSVLDIDLNEKKLKISIAYQDSSLVPISTLAGQTGAIAAINGNYFHTTEGGSVCFLKVGGQILDTSRTDLTESLFLEQLDDIAFTIDASNRADIMVCPPVGWKSVHEIPTILSAGPVLVNDGQIVSSVPHSFNDSRYGRSGAGITANNHLILITVDGNTAGSAGMSITEFARLFKVFNCVRAMNLDGGGSAAMWIKGKPHKGIVSHPSDNKTFDHLGERAIANAIVIIMSNDQ